MLHPDLGAALGGERFLSEIRTTARLQHPHILPLLDSGDADGLLYYVMPLVTGETLHARMERERQLPIPEAVRIAREVASALDYAHRQGVIYRDIKPENILLQDGSALVADFGIALAVQSAGGARMTQTGLSLGTPQYMSPEQAMGERTIDARSDIYALGAMTYEMLAGDAPFTGGSVQAIVAKVLTEKPTPLHTLRDTVPGHIEAAVLTALAKLPADRFASAAEFASALGASPTVATTLGARRAAPVSRATRVLPWVVTAVAVLAAVVVGQRRAPASSPATSRQQVSLWKVPLPSPLDAGASISGAEAAIAPDGSAIVYSDSTPSGRMLFRKARDAAEGVPLAGTERGVSPFYSPDGKWIAFATTDGVLRKLPATGEGGAVTLVQSMGSGIYKFGAWLEDGSIVYTLRRRISRVSADGTPMPPPNIAKYLRGGLEKNDVQSASPLPGARGFLFSVCPNNCSIGSAVSASGAALYAVDRTAASPSALMWVSRQGQAEPVDSSWRGRFEYPAIAPDGRSLAVSVRDKTTDLWIWRAMGDRQKVRSAAPTNWRPSWTGDGAAVAFVAIGSPDESESVHAVPTIVRADGSTTTSPIVRAARDFYEVELSRNGEWRVLRTDETRLSKLFVQRLVGDTALRELSTEGSSALQVALYPDGRWLAYTANGEIALQSFPDPTQKVVVSRDGGSEPRWSGNGRELFFQSKGQMMVVAVPPGPTFTPGLPRALFSVQGYRTARNRSQYDVTPDGQRFVMIRESSATTLVYVENWFAELLAKAKR